MEAETEATMREKIKIGSILRNGAVVLAMDDEFVLAFWEGHTFPFVTWRCDDRGYTVSGNYHGNVFLAANDYGKRLKGQ